MSAQIQNQSPQLWEAIFQHAVQFFAGGQLAEASSLFVAIIEHNPTHFPSLQRLAAIRRRQGRNSEALALLETAVTHHPDSPEIHNSLGNALCSLGRFEDAIAQFERAISLNRNLPEVELNLGNCFKVLGSYQKAAEAYQAAIALRPEYLDAHTNLGIVLERLNRPEDALVSFYAALSLDTSSRVAHGNVGMALTDLNRHHEAIPALQRSRQLDPDSLESVFNESIVHLALGNFDRGLRDYEARWGLPGFQQRTFTQPIWDGESSIRDKTIMLHAEQGLGDTILFLRYVEPLVNLGARVIVAIQDPLLDLVSRMHGVTQVLASRDPLPSFDLHIPLGSLPLAFKTTIDTIPSRVPYLKAPGMSDTITPEILRPDTRPLIGVCWAGNPDYPSDYKRSIPLEMFKRLFQVTGVRFVSLQHQLRPGDESTLSNFTNIDLVSEKKGRTLADTAALISRLDLVITVDTVISHLAGALGRPVWTLLRFSGYWVWLLDRADSPWYPTARLFRQSKPGDWESMLEQVALRLAVEKGSLYDVVGGKSLT